MSISMIEVNVWCNHCLPKPPVCCAEAPASVPSEDGGAELFAFSSVPLLYTPWHYRGRAGEAVPQHQAGTWAGGGQPCAERCWTEPLRRLPWGTELQCWFCKALSRPSEKRESLRKESIEIAPCQRSSRFGTEWRNSWWYMLTDPQMRLSKDTCLLRHRHRSIFNVQAFSPLALEQLWRPCPSLLVLLGSPSVARI